MKASVALALLGSLVVAACSSSSPSPQGGGGQDASYVAPEGGVTWADWRQGFFTKYCVECHGASNPDGLDFGQQSIVVANKATIRCGVSVTQDPSWACSASVSAKQFPISDTAGTNPKPSDAERDEVVAWIDAGCP
jgi:hypothetical protein